MGKWLLMGLLAFVVGVGLGYRLGYGMAEGACASRERAVAMKTLEATASVVEAGRVEVERQQRATVQTAKREAATAARQVREEQNYEAFIENRAECGRSDAAFGLLVGAIRRANAGTDPDGAGAVPDGLPANAGAGRAGGGGDGPLGIEDGALGRGVRYTTQ